MERGACRGAGRAPAAVRRRSYRGINVLLLWSAAMANGYGAPVWMTFKQARDLNAHVRKGEQGSPVVYADKLTRAETDPNRRGGRAGHSLHEELHGLLMSNRSTACPNISTPSPHRAVRPCRASWRRTHSLPPPAPKSCTAGSRACYVASTDNIHMPCIDFFRDAESYYATLAHEATHNADIRIMPTSVQMSRKWSHPVHRCRHNQRNSRKATDRPLAPSAVGQ